MPRDPKTRSSQQVSQQDNNSVCFPSRKLTALADHGQLSIVYERKDAISTLITMMVSHVHNILLIGEPVSGKTAIIESLASWIVRLDDKVPHKMYHRDVLECTVSDLISGSGVVGELEKRIKNLMNAVVESGAILVIDNIHEAIGAGATKGDEWGTIANGLIPYLSRNEATVIGTTTPQCYEVMRASNPSFCNRFKPLYVHPTSISETRDILSGIKSLYEKKHCVDIPDETLDKIIDLSDKLLPNRVFPGKAFEILTDVILAHKKRAGTEKQLTLEALPLVLQEKTGLTDAFVYPKNTVTKADLQKFFSENIFGQSKAISSVCDAIRRFKLDLNDPDKPIDVFLFVGPSGVGKTQLAKVVAECLFGNSRNLLRYDMSRYNTPASVSKFIGGEQNDLKPGKLLNDIRINPVAVILLDEIEKADPDIFNVLLSITGEGRLIDDYGNVANFRNTIIIMTSNIGSELYEKKITGFRQSDEPPVSKEDINRAIEACFNPEFRGRMRIVQFQPLKKDAVVQIAQKEIREIMNRKGFKKLGIKIEITDKLMNKLLETGYHPARGARLMRRAVEDLLVNGIVLNNAGS